jgi:hypothetical protein
LITLELKTIDVTVILQQRFMVAYQQKLLGLGYKRGPGSSGHRFLL